MNDFFKLYIIVQIVVHFAIAFTFSLIWLLEKVKFW